MQIRTQTQAFRDISQHAPPSLHLNKTVSTSLLNPIEQHNKCGEVSTQYHSCLILQHQQRSAARLHRKNVTKFNNLTKNFPNKLLNYRLKSPNCRRTKKNRKIPHKKRGSFTCTESNTSGSRNLGRGV